jgi:hypothetical protein
MGSKDSFQELNGIGLKIEWHFVRENKGRFEG